MDCADEVVWFHWSIILQASVAPFFASMSSAEFQGKVIPKIKQAMLRSPEIAVFGE